MNLTDIWNKLTRPLASRKVRVAFATVIAAWAAEYGFDLSEQFVLTILTVGASLILAIAHEDAGRKAFRLPQDAAEN